MFLGEYDRSLDTKGRITLPATFRDALAEEGAILTRGLDRCIVLFPRQVFEAWREKISALPLTDGRSRALRRHVFSGAGEVIPDSSGRINLPPYLRRYAGLNGAVVVAGSDTYIEIWDALHWTETRGQFEASGDDTAAWDALGV